MAFIHKFQLVIAVGLVSILIIGISSVDCDKVEDRSRKDYQSPYYPVQDNISSIKKILDYIKSKFTDNTQVGARTFHQIKKFQSALLPIMYKLGVISTIIMITLFLAMKGVFIGTVILILNIAFLAAKVGGLFDKGHHSHAGWSSGLTHGSLQKDVHLHIHNGNKPPPQYVPYSASASPSWEPANQGWSHYGGPYESGRHMKNMGNPDEMHITSTDKADTKPFEIIYPESESHSQERKFDVSPYNYVKHYRKSNT